MSQRIDTRFTYLTTLRDGWLDGSGKAPSASALAAAREIVDLLPECKPYLYPTEYGGIQIEIDGDWDVEIECCSPNRIEVRASRPATDEDKDAIFTTEQLEALIQFVEPLLKGSS